MDRLVLSLINRGQIKPQDFVTEASGAVSLKADARKLLFQALQAKKQEKIVHPFLDEEVEIGLLPYIYVCSCHACPFNEYCLQLHANIVHKAEKHALLRRIDALISAKCAEIKLRARRKQGDGFSLLRL